MWERSHTMSHASTLKSVAALALTLALSAAASAQSPHPSFDVKVTGHGPAVVLIPGLLSTGEVWETTVERYKDRYTLHVLTLAGFGGPAPIGPAGTWPVGSWRGCGGGRRRGRPSRRPGLSLPPRWSRLGPPRRHAPAISISGWVPPSPPTRRGSVTWWSNCTGSTRTAAIGGCCTT